MILKFLNMLFRIFLIFLICFVWMRYFIDELWQALLYTALLTISIEFILHFIFVKKNMKKSLKIKEQELAEKISITFVFSQPKAINYFYNLAKIHYDTKKTSKYITILRKNNDNKKDEQSEILEANNEFNKTILYPFYSYNAINPQNLVEILKEVDKIECNKLIVCGYKIDKDTYKLAQKISDKKIILLDSSDTYLKIIKQYNYFPEKLKDIKSIDKVSLKDILKSSLSRKNSKGFLISSLILLFSSFIVRLNIYYVIISSLLLLFALLSFFLPQKPKITDDSVF